jgi:hypothetical protein
MKLRLLLAGVALFVGVVPGVGLAPTPACAAGGPHAALVVDTGEDVYPLCVGLDADTVSGIHLIELAGEQYDLSYRLGFGGKAVCELAGVGTQDDDCFSEYPDFWGYWHGDGSGGWSWAGSGAASYQVKDGDVEGWSWGSGSDGDTHNRPPDTTFESVCGYRPQTPSGGDDNGGSQPKHHDSDGDGSHDGGQKKTSSNDGGKRKTHGSGKSAPVVVQPEVTPTPTEPQSGPDTAEKKEGRVEKKHKKGSGAAAEQKSVAAEDATPSPAPSFEALPASARTDDGGPPVAGLIGIALAALCMGAAAFVIKRRSRTG